MPECLLNEYYHAILVGTIDRRFTIAAFQIRRPHSSMPVAQKMGLLQYTLSLFTDKISSPLKSS